MNWLEISLRVGAAQVDAVADLFSEIGYQGVAIEREGILPDHWDEGTLPPARQYTVKAYLPDDAHTPAKRKALTHALRHIQAEPPVFRQVAEENWADAWKKHYHPLRVGQRILIRPPWEASPNRQTDDIEIVLDPGMAFGTGTHTTTQLCLQALERRLPPGARMLDLGCGSGILSVAAVLLGAGHVYATDIDPVAVDAARENIRQNNTHEHIDLAVGGLPDLLQAEKTFEFAAVNILARIIIQMCDQGLGDVIEPGGHAIFSGVIEPQLDEVQAALRQTGLLPKAYQQQGDWILIEAQKPLSI